MSEEPTSTTPRTALVTGAASGIGRTIALHLRENGWKVFVCDADPSAVRQFTEEAPDVESFICDVSDPKTAQATAVAVMGAAGGALDLLVNNAGVAGMTGPVEDIDTDDWRRTIDINVNGAFYFLKAIVPAMKTAGRGVILNIASTAALFGYPNRTPYAASKWAMIGLTKTLAMELGPHGIRVNAICPGSVEGPRIDGVIERDALERGMKPEAVRRIYEGQVSMRNFISAQDIAEMCSFLASDAARLVSGQVIAVDGHTESLSVPG